MAESFATKCALGCGGVPERVAESYSVKYASGTGGDFGVFWLSHPLSSDHWVVEVTMVRVAEEHPIKDVLGAWFESVYLSGVKG